MIQYLNPDQHSGSFTEEQQSQVFILQDQDQVQVKPLLLTSTRTTLKEPRHVLQEQPPPSTLRLLKLPELRILNLLNPNCTIFLQIHSLSSAPGISGGVCADIDRKLRQNPPALYAAATRRRQTPENGGAKQQRKKLQK
ncbi:uncharacterized protein V6R79_020766 [Siganus canaliculatus]